MIVNVLGARNLQLPAGIEFHDTSRVDATGGAVDRLANHYLEIDDVLDDPQATQSAVVRRAVGTSTLASELF